MQGGGVADNQQVTNLSKKLGVKIFQLLSSIYYFFQHRETIKRDKKHGMEGPIDTPN